MQPSTVPHMKAAIYLRISKYASDSTSIERQEEACRGQAEAIGIRDVETFRDIDRSGYDPDVERPGFGELLSRLSDFSHLIVYRIDRLTRQGARHLLSIVEDELTPNDVRLVSATEPIDTSGPYGELFLVLLSTFAKMESERISERTLSTKEYLRANGYWFSGEPPFGFRAIDDGSGHKRLSPIPEEASHITSAVERVLDGEPLTEVAEDFPMSYTGLQKLFINPVLAGYQTKSGEILYDDMGDLVMVGEPIIDGSTHFQLVNALTSAGHSRARKHLLTGILVCDECGYGMTGNSRSYQCQGCDSNSASKARVEEIVIEWVKGELPAYLEEGKKQHEPSEEVDGDRLHLKHLLTQLNEQIDKLTLDGGLDYDNPQVARLNERASKVQERLLNLRRTPEPVQVNVNVEQFDSFPIHRKRSIISAIIPEIPVKKAAGVGGRFDPARVLLPPRERGDRREER